MTEATSGSVRPELIFALVGQAGVPLSKLGDAIAKSLESFNYEVSRIHLSSLLENFIDWKDASAPGEFVRIAHRQEMGLAFRKKLNGGDGSALARAGIAQIRHQRKSFTGNPDLPAPSRAFILEQLKHPDEVELLRKVYGSSFFLIAGHGNTNFRTNALSARIARENGQVGKNFQKEAISIIEDDEKQDEDLGQNTRDTYPLADFFANLSLEGGEARVDRFIELLFGHPFHTPTPEEHAMYQATATSFRSSDKNRQVGAVIANINRDHLDSERIIDIQIVATGMNEVPRGGGGYYFPDVSPDRRDQVLAEDRAHQIKIAALTELIEKIKTKTWLSDSISGKSPHDLAIALLPDLKRTQFMGIGEFMRPVHAEMAALIDGARRGVAVNGLNMYVTTFPCHNCAKHIIAAGLKKVVYLEPYPKSRAAFLHGEELSLVSLNGNEEPGKVVFFPFSGIAPRQFRDVFQMTQRGERTLSEWGKARKTLGPYYVRPNASKEYLYSERQALEELDLTIYEWDKSNLCPI